MLFHQPISNKLVLMMLSILLLGCNSPSQTTSQEDSKSIEKSDTTAQKNGEQKNKDQHLQPSAEKKNHLIAANDIDSKKTPEKLMEKKIQQLEKKSEIAKGKQQVKLIVDGQGTKAVKDAPHQETSTENTTTTISAEKEPTDKVAAKEKDAKIASKDSTKKYEVIKDNPFNPAKNASVDELVEHIITMLQESTRVQKRPGFVSALLNSVDLILNSKDAKNYQRNFAILSKFKALHMAATTGDKIADSLLGEFAKEMNDNKTKKISSWVKFVKMEHRILAAEKLKSDELETLLKDLKAYLGDANTQISNNHLRMAGNTVGLINRLDKTKREGMLKELGKLYAKSIDSDLKKYGEQLGQPPKVKPGALIGQEMKLVASKLGGARYDLKDHRGKVVIVDFWASWCGPCKAEIPRVKKVLDKYATKNFDVIGVSIDRDEEKLKDYIFDHPLPWDTVNGTLAQQVAKQYGVRQIPTLFLIDKYGKIVAKANHVSAFENKIDDLLKVEYKLENDESKKPPKNVPVG